MSATLTLSDPAGGVLTNPGSVISAYDAATGVWTASGAIADVNVLLAAVSFAPAPDFNADLTIATWVSEGTASVTGTKVLTGVAVNDAPTSTNDRAATAEDLVLVLAPGDFGTYADADSDPLAAVRITALETDGDLEYDTTGAGQWTDVTVGQDVGVSALAAGRLRFVPDPDESGAPYATIGFRVSDGVGLCAAAYTLTIDVSAVNDAP